MECPIVKQCLEDEPQSRQSFADGDCLPAAGNINHIGFRIFDSHFNGFEDGEMVGSKDGSQCSVGTELISRFYPFKIGCLPT